MKKIELKLVEKTPQTEGMESWKDLLLYTVNHVNPQAPLNLEQMDERLNVMNKIKAIPHGGFLELEDAEFRVLSECTAKYPIYGVSQMLSDCFKEVKKINEEPAK